MKKAVYLLSIIFLISCNKSSKVFELTSVDSADATLSVLNAIEKCKSEGTSKLIIPKGRYVFYPEKSVQRYCVTSNNDNGMKRIAFPIHEMKNLEIDGQGSEFIFHGHIIPFNVDGSENITLKNFSIDWEQPFHAEGSVIAVNETQNTFDVKFPVDKKHHLENGAIIFDGEGWTQDVGPNIFFDTIQRATVYRVAEYKLDPWNPINHTRFHVDEISKGILRVKDTVAKLPQQGWRWAISGKRELWRQSPAIRIYFSKNVKLENVDIHHAGAMGILGERSENVSLIKTRVILPENKDRVVTTTADATHFVNCKGTILMDSCLFENMLDDATNIHGIYARFINQVNDHTIGIKAMHHQQNLTHFAEAGDSIRFVNNKTMETVAVLKCNGFRFINDRYAEISFDSPVKDIPVNSGIDNLSWYPQFIMRNSEVRNNRARSILISTNKKVLVENNTFRHPMMAAISISGDVNYWFESGNVTDVIIRNNHFIDCCSGGQNQAVISIEPVIPDKAARRSGYHKNIIIENNLIETFDRAVLDALSTDHLEFINNKIIRTTTYASIFPDKPVLYLSACSNVLVENNDYSGQPAANIEHDSLSKSIDVKNNKNFIEIK